MELGVPDAQSLSGQGFVAYAPLAMQDIFKHRVASGCTISSVGLLFTFISVHESQQNGQSDGLTLCMQSFANADVEMLRVFNLSVIFQQYRGFAAASTKFLIQKPDRETRSIVTLKRAQLPTEPTRLAPSTSCLARTHITCTTCSSPAKLLQHNQRHHLSQSKNLFNSYIL